MTNLVVIFIVYRVERRCRLVSSFIYSYKSESESESKSYNYKSSVSKNHPNSILIVNYDF